MRLICEYQTTTEVEAWNHVSPFIYESAEAFIVHFEDKMKAYLAADSNKKEYIFNLGGMIFECPDHFYRDSDDKCVINLPEIYTIDEWFYHVERNT
ncbi:MAG: hypothetical protein COA52_01305 [Hyphomicrobiales bacterium]|nr:MAG: hypothetical protein COA52_00215 [Hyphomicrobiales bacterium]PCJ96869.1 MAG: hypothetical protein COA52_01305 [Hyphomicrobiales bacterium]